MTNARISKTAQAVLRNRPLARAIALALANGSYESEENRISIKLDGKEYTIRIVESSLGTEVKLIAKE